jgi:hypothetical protein
VTVTGMPVEVEQVAKNFKELQASMSPERRARVAERVNVALKTLALDELREARSGPGFCIEDGAQNRHVHLNPAQLYRSDGRCAPHQSSVPGW